jgi:hypothetical protein
MSSASSSVLRFTAHLGFRNPKALRHLRQDARWDQLGQNADEGHAGPQAKDEPGCAAARRL